MNAQTDYYDMVVDHVTKKIINTEKKRPQIRFIADAKKCIRREHKSNGMFNLLTRVVMENFLDSRMDREETEQTLLQIAKLNEQGLIRYQ